MMLHGGPHTPPVACWSEGGAGDPSHTQRVDADLQALVALIDTEVVWDRGHRQALQEGHGEQFADRTYDEMADRHDRSVQTFAALTGKPRPEAELAVAGLLNHATRLAEAFQWFRQGSALWRAALSESVRYAAGDREVPSRPAQEAWEPMWEHMQRPWMAFVSHENPYAGLREPWQQAWASWADGN
jgi:hypothetical protein